MRNGVQGCASLLAMLAGGLIYLLCRTDSLLLFSWLDTLGLAPGVAALRETGAALAAGLPQWVVYSLPNALWTASGILAFDLVWGSGRSPEGVLWSALFFGLALSAEAAQAPGLLPGTFDIRDFVLIAVAGLGSAFVISANNTQRKGDESHETKHGR